VFSEPQDEKMLTLVLRVHSWVPLLLKNAFWWQMT